MIATLHRNTRTALRKAICILTLAVGILTSCEDSVVFHQYKSIDKEGWYVRDTLVFLCDTINGNGEYDAFLCLRTDNNYPYKSFTALTKLYRNEKMENKEWQHSTTIAIKEEDGTDIGQGVVFHTHEKLLNRLHLNAGDSLRIVIRHYMKRETMPGIRDVGIKIQRCSNDITG